MTEYLSDKEQIEMFKKWWHDYGRGIAVAIVLGLLIGLGWRYCHQHNIKKAERASQIYTQLQILSEKNEWDKTKRLTDELIQHYAKTPYAAMASLISAKNAVAQDHLETALIRLRWAIKNASMPSVKEIARLRAARILLAQNHPKAALHLLQTVNDATYRPLVDNVKGDIYTAMGDQTLAAKSYKAAQNGMKAIGIDDPYLKMKI